MSAEIQFIKGIKENSLPIVKLTKSRNQKTGTATFIFMFPEIFEYTPYENITGMTLLWDNNNRIITNEIFTTFKSGKPLLLKSIFIFKNSQEWFDFLMFMNCYSKETGLIFTENT